MKKVLKRSKFVVLMLVMFIVMGMIPGPVLAARVINHYLYTDIIATIDGHQIRAYNIDGYTNVVAEDLVNYGFEVKWDELRRRLDISRRVDPTVTSNYSAPRASKDMIGKIAGDVLYTDIDTYVEGKRINSYNINGYTCVNIEEVAKILYCKSVYNDYERHLYITRRPFPDFNTIRGVQWNDSVSHFATYRDLDIQVLSADAYNVTFKYRLYNEYSDETISAGTISVPYHPEIFKYHYQINSYTWDDVYKLGLVTDMFVVPFGDGREFCKIRLIFGEDCVMYETTSSSSLFLSSSYELVQK